MTTSALAALGGLESAEDFLDHFAIPYDRARLMPQRIRLLRRFRAVIDERPETTANAASLRDALAGAYRDCTEGTVTGQVTGRGRRLISPPPGTGAQSDAESCAPAAARSCSLGCC
jgi:hypothetical protein